MDNLSQAHSGPSKLECEEYSSGRVSIDKTSDELQALKAHYENHLQLRVCTPFREKPLEATYPFPTALRLLGTTTKNYYIYTCVYIYLYICFYVYIYIYLNIFFFIYIYIYASACVYIYIYYCRCYYYC